MTDLVERLHERAESYRQGGPSSEHTAVMLEEAASRISQQDAELERMRRHIELLQEKDESQCACSIDTPDDVCLFHVRMKAEARKAAFIEAAEMASLSSSPSVYAFAAMIRAKAEETDR